MTGNSSITFNVKQERTLDALLVTHRELSVVDIVEYALSWTAGHCITIKIKSGDRYFNYRLMASGNIDSHTIGNSEFISKQAKYYQS